MSRSGIDGRLEQAKQTHSIYPSASVRRRRRIVRSLIIEYVSVTMTRRPLRSRSTTVQETVGAERATTSNEVAR